MSELFKRSFQLFKLTIRRDRIRASIWIFALAFFTLIIPGSFQNLYPDQQDRDAMAVTMENPAMVAMVGEGDLDNYTIGAMSAHQMVLITAVFVGIMSILLFVRHTRTDEEEGRVELTVPCSGTVSNAPCHYDVCCVCECRSCSVGCDWFNGTTD